MSPRASAALTSCPGRAWNAEAATIQPAAAPTVAGVLAATAPPRGPCTTWATRAATALSTCRSATPSITAATVAATSPVICPTWPCPSASTPAAFSKWLSAWWLRMAYPTAPPPGTYGATTGSSSRTPPSRTGSRPPGEKKVETLSGTYLDEALANFSGYLTIDEVYDGPFCILSVV